MATKESARKKHKAKSLAEVREAKTPKRKAAGRQAGTSPRGSRAKTPGRSGAGVLQRFFPKVLSTKGGPAEGALLVVAIRSETGLEVRSIAFEEMTGAARGSRTRAAAICSDVKETARLLRGLAHPERLYILNAMRQGARKHIELKAAVELAAGPLYHHLRELERSGLIDCPSRNDYVLTGSGRRALLIISGLSALAAKSRRTAPWKVESFQKRLAKPGQSKPSRPKRRR